MGLSDKIKNAKDTTWLTDGLSDTEVKTTVELAKISALIERRRIDMGMTQLDFAKYMGVTQGMISKWESREYNFTIRSLNEICEKLGLILCIDMKTADNDEDHRVILLKDRSSKKKNENESKLSGELIEL